MTPTFRSLLDVTRAEWLSGLGLAEAEIPEAVILEGSWWRADRQSLRLAHLTEVRELGFPDIFWGRWRGRPVVFCMAYGAPRAVEVSQIFASLGAKLVVQIGTCGGLQAHLRPGDIVIPDQILCADGVAEHMVADARTNASPPHVAAATSALSGRDRTTHKGPHVTFAALFAETTEMQLSWHEAGLLSVDMEAATTIAAAAQFDVPGVAMLVVWDELTAGRRFLDPMAPVDQAELEISNAAVFDAALELVEELS